MSQPWKLTAKGLKLRQKRVQPSAPTKLEVSFYEKFAKIAEKGNALILGVTPELRDICLEQGFKTHSLDVSQEIIDMWNQAMDHKNHPDDIVIKGNWFNMKFPANHFNIVMGDAAFCNLATKEDNKKLFSILKRVIKPGGFFVTRNIFKPELTPIPKTELVQMFRNKDIDFADFIMELRGVTYLDQIYNQKTYQYNAIKNFELIEKDHADGIFSKEERDRLMVFRNDIINTFYPFEEFIQLAASYGFKLIEQFKSTEYRYMQYLNMVVFQK